MKKQLKIFIVSLIVIFFVSLAPSFISDAKTTSGWKHNKTGWWYVTSNGSYYQKCWKKIKGKWYYFKADGYMAHDEYINGYYLTSNGEWDCKDQCFWVKKNGTWYYMYKHSIPFTYDMEDLEYYCFAKINNKVYCFNNEGQMYNNVFIGNNDFKNNFCDLNLPAGFSWIGKNGQITYKGILQVTNNNSQERYLQVGDTYKDTLGWIPKNKIYIFVDTTYGGYFNVYFDGNGKIKNIETPPIIKKED